MTESKHQAALIQWASIHPVARLMFAIPNGTHIISHQGRAKAKKEGLKKGVPDLFLPVARGEFHGLFIELKKPKDENSAAGKPSKEQLQWLDDLSEQGYMAVLCVGWDAARKTIEQYLNVEKGQSEGWIEDHKDVGEEFGTVVKRINREFENKCKNTKFNEGEDIDLVNTK